MLEASDARTLRQFLSIVVRRHRAPRRPTRSSPRPACGRGSRPASSKPAEIAKLHEAMRNVNLNDGQSMNVLRYANRVPLQFQAGACAITQTVMGTNWRSYGLSQSRGSLPSGPVTVMVHMASVWVPFTSESKEAVAGYPEIQKELRLALQAVGRKLGMFLRRRNRVKHEGRAAARSSSATWAKWPTPSAASTSTDRDKLYERLLEVAKKRTAEADVQLDDRGRPIEEDEADFGENVMIVEPTAEREVPAAVEDRCSRSKMSRRQQSCRKTRRCTRILQAFNRIASATTELPYDHEQLCMPTHADTTPNHSNSTLATARP